MGSEDGGEGEDTQLAERAIALAEEKFLAASGPGGQNVNKVATAVQLSLDVFALRLSPPIFHRLKQLAGKRMTASGQLTLTVRAHRTQQANREEARMRLTQLLGDAQKMPTKRKKSRLNRVGKRQRLESKKARAKVKANRAKPSW